MPVLAFDSIRVPPRPTQRRENIGRCGISRIKTLSPLNWKVSTPWFFASAWKVLVVKAALRTAGDSSFGRSSFSGTIPPSVTVSKSMYRSRSLSSPSTCSRRTASKYRASHSKSFAIASK